MSGFLGGMSLEGMASDIEKRGLHRSYQAHLANHAAALTQWHEIHGAMLAERQALREALRKFDPNHPLLVDKKLRESIQDAGERAFMANDGDTADDDAIAVGKNAKYPYEQPPSVAALQAKVEQLEAENVQNYAEKHALRRVVQRYALNHPLTWKVEGSPVIASLRRAALTAFSFTKDYAAVRDAALNFRFPADYMGYGPVPVRNPLEEYPEEESAVSDFYKGLTDVARQRSALETRELLRQHAAKSPK